ncbi:uncharacterized protein LOC126852036 [Cataglyphis hispanica]|uniref:uncharacterized protein LOC126852036 n=1 Tax=Cataglyphis hispanica TaxID=1086592 RepID=UPI00217F5EEA|nr:uncharacterized protein LOC126852036 [Cataglyphis hispanica]
MMHFARLMRILTQIFYCLYSFVTSIASIKASTAFILFLSVFLVLLPISAIHTESDTKRQIQNTESENDIKYSVQPTTFINNPIWEENEDVTIFLIIATIFCTILVTVFLIWCPTWCFYNLRMFDNFDDVFDDLDDLQQNNNQNNRWIHMNGPIRGQRVARERILNE